MLSHGGFARLRVPVLFIRLFSNEADHGDRWPGTTCRPHACTCMYMYYACTCTCAI